MRAPSETFREDARANPHEQQQQSVRRLEETVANPIVSIVVPVAGIVAGLIGNKAAAVGWRAVFGEDAPIVKSQKAAKKDVAQRRKQAKKDGLSKAEIDAIKDPSDDQPIWKLRRWATVSGVLLQGLRVAAKRGAQKGAERLTTRRPRTNRG